MKQCDTIYLITLAGAIDDLPVAVFDTRAGVDAFILSNRPCPVDGRDAIREGPLADAYKAAGGRGPSIVLGYQVWEIKDGVPVRNFLRRWTDGQWPGVREWKRMTTRDRENFEKYLEDGPWEPKLEPAIGPPAIGPPTIGPQEEWNTNDGDHLGGGPVG